LPINFYFIILFYQLKNESVTSMLVLFAYFLFFYSFIYILFYLFIIY